MLLVEPLKINLGIFLQRMENSLSLKTKIYIMYLLTQSLRYLKSYQIVHLDLKPGNVMMCPNLEIKLIDFGESYHPNVPGNALSMQSNVPVSPFLTQHLKTTRILLSMTTHTKMISFLWE